MFLGLPGPHPNPLVRDTDPNLASDPDPSYHQAKIERKILSPNVL
jgi:hypothetical protein